MKKKVKKAEQRNKQTKKQGKKILLEIFGVLVITRLAIYLIGYFSNLAMTFLTKGGYYPRVLLESASLSKLFFRWDSGWYIGIMKYGYSFAPGRESSVAFFPLYPMLVKIFSFNLFNPVIIGYLISNIALFLAVLYLYKLVYLETKEHKTSFKSVFYLLIFPTSFFFSIFYTEGLFLFLAISCFYYARKKQWLTASILGLFLSMTRVIGVLIFIPMLVEYFDINFKSWKMDIKKIRGDILYLLLVPLGLLFYMFFLYIKFGKPFAFLDAQLAWGRYFVIPFAPLIMEFNYRLFHTVIFKGFAIFALLMILYLFFSKVRFSYGIYALSILAVCLSTSSLDSTPRLVSVIFPIYLAMALASKKKYLEYIFIIFSIIFLALFLTLFVNGYWFT